GVLGSFANSPSDFEARAASGAVSSDGTIALDTNPGDYGNANIDLTRLFEQIGVAGLTDAILNEASLEVGALVATAAKLPHQDVQSEYRVADLKLNLTSPLVGGIVADLRSAVDAI